MAFPTNTTLLDDFNRADEDPITTNWTTPVFTGDGNQALSGNAFGGRGEAAYYDITQFAEDQEAHATLTVLPAAGLLMRIGLRTQGQGTASKTMYTFASYNPGAGWVGSIYGQKAGVDLGNLTGEQAIATPVPGDKFGAQAIGSALTYWYFHGGSWSNIASVTDTQITGAGYLQLGMDDATSRWDDFRGGNVVTTGKNPSIAWVSAIG